ncbi:nucleoside triphosphate hydrolase [bacterium]|nr:nucleoside triphosphate hydrolase [bacterium]
MSDDPTHEDSRLAAVADALAAPLCVAGFEERVVIRREELRRFHIPLAERIAERAGECPRRFLVAIVGVPGSGKSIFAAVMERVLGVVAPRLGPKAVGIDGYHFANATLDARPAPAGDGSLRAFKGAPFTFDVARLAADLRRLRDGPGRLCLPEYDRTLHDSVEGRLAVEPHHRLILVEGNWLLHDAHGWGAIGPLFDLSLFLALPPEANRGPLIARHLRGGRSREDATLHYERVDRPNTRLVAATRTRADVVVHLDAGHAVLGNAEGTFFGGNISAK